MVPPTIAIRTGRGARGIHLQARRLSGTVAYAPYGEAYNWSGTPDLSFAGQDRDTTPNLYDMVFRRYPPVYGRWTSPDPAGLGAVSFVIRKVETGTRTLGTVR